MEIYVPSKLPLLNCGPDVGIGDTCVSYLPWHHSFGALAERLWAIGNGCCLHVVPQVGKNGCHLIAAIQQVKPSIFMSVPKMHHRIAMGGYLDPSRGALGVQRRRYFGSGCRGILPPAKYTYY